MDHIFFIPGRGGRGKGKKGTLRGERKRGGGGDLEASVDLPRLPPFKQVGGERGEIRKEGGGGAP